MSNHYPAFLKQARRKRLETVAIALTAGIISRPEHIQDNGMIADSAIELAKTLIEKLDKEDV